MLLGQVGVLLGPLEEGVLEVVPWGRMVQQIDPIQESAQELFFVHPLKCCSKTIHETIKSKFLHLGLGKSYEGIDKNV